MSTILNFKDIFQSFIDQTKKEWAHDRSETVGASEAFDCIRKTWFKKRGEEFYFFPDEDHEQSWGATKRGDILELNYVVPAVKDNLPKGTLLRWAGERQKTLFKGKNSATPDGIITGLSSDALSLYGIEDIGSDCVMFEIKSIDPRVRLENEKKLHLGQTQVQMGIVRDTTKYKPNYAVIIYINASFLDDIKTFVTKFDPEYWKAAQDRAELVFETRDPGDLMPEGFFEKTTCDFCPYTSACALVTTGRVPDDTKEKAPDELIEEFRERIAKYREAETAFNEASAEFERIKHEMKEALVQAGRRKVGVKKEWSVSWSAQKGRQTLDTKALIEAAGVEDLDPFYKQGNPFEVLRVSFTTT